MGTEQERFESLTSLTKVVFFNKPYDKTMVIKFLIVVIIVLSFSNFSLLFQAYILIKNQNAIDMIDKKQEFIKKSIRIETLNIAFTNFRIGNFKEYKFKNLKDPKEIDNIISVTLRDGYDIPLIYKNINGRYESMIELNNKK